MTRPSDAAPSPPPSSSPASSPERYGVAHRAPRIDVDREDVERGLAGLVLTVVELLRQLMERQAIRRMEHGDLTEDQIERMGTTLMLLEERMHELQEHFGLSPEDLNLDLGPLGSLLPRG